MVDEARCIHRLTPAFIPDSLSGAGATAGLWGSCWPAQLLLGQKKITRSPRENSAERQGSVPQASPGPLHRQHKRFCRDAFQPQGLCVLLACLCLFFLVNLTEFRWGALQIEQAREVLTKLERKVNLFLSLAKEPFSKTPPNTDKIAFIPLFPFWAIMTSVFSILLFPLTPDLYFFFIAFLSKLYSSFKRSGDCNPNTAAIGRLCGLH